MQATLNIRPAGIDVAYLYLIYIEHPVGIGTVCPLALQLWQTPIYLSKTLLLLACGGLPVKRLINGEVTSHQIGLLVGFQPRTDLVNGLRIFSRFKEEKYDRSPTGPLEIDEAAYRRPSVPGGYLPLPDVFDPGTTYLTYLQPQASSCVSRPLFA